ncbi:MAG TPA: class I SAM-dependent methyltransferase [Polyangiaceae bacterium]|nr:class I SAM-dependent methyltransferase [Polyangiaceae bacterium]
MNQREGESHWSAVAERWKLVGPPLRPSSVDAEEYARVVLDWAAVQGSPRALILGVTPELYGLPWPTGTTLSAVDHTQAMIDALWPGPKGSALRAEWTDLPVPSGSVDIAVCDGGLHLLSHPNQQLAMVRSLERVLVVGGLFIVRLFVPPAQQESVDRVLRDLDSGAIPNLNVLKLRLGMALQQSATEGVELHHVWSVLQSQFPDFEALARRLGWELAHLQAIDTYRNCQSRYHFVSLEEVQQMFCGEDPAFELVSVHAGSYALGERCPLVVLRRLRAAAR